MSAHELVIERAFAAPRDAVFRAWVSPEVLRRWWGAGPDWTSPAVEIDLRPGGRYRLSMQDPSGTVRTVGGEYVEVDPPRRLVYTWAWETHGAANDAPTLVTVEFHEGGAGRDHRRPHPHRVCRRRAAGHAPRRVGAVPREPRDARARRRLPGRRAVVSRRGPRAP